MKQIFTAILLALGIPQAKIDAMTALTDDQAKEFKHEEIVTEISTGFRNKLSNDQEFLNSIPEDKVPEATKKKIEKGQYARFQNELIETAVNKLGLTDKDTFTDDDKKSIKVLVEKMARAYQDKNNGTEGLTKLQKDLQKALEDKTTLEEQLNKKLVDREAELNTGFGDKMIKTLTTLSLSSLDKIKLTVPPAYIADPILAKMKGKYSVILKGEELDIKQKDNPALDVLDTKSGKKIGFNDALRSMVLEDKVGTEITDDDGGGGKKTKVRVDGGGEGGENGETAVASYISDKIDANIAAEADAK